MMFDPLYMLVMGLGLVLSLGAQAWVKASTAKWDRVPIGRGLTGADVAAAILRVRGIHDVTIEQVGGVLSDHYDPSSRTLRLSPANYSGRSITAAGIAAHEVGHAVQHAEGYAPMALRQKMVPVANIGTNLGVWIVIAGVFTGITGLAKIGVGLFAGFVLFTLVTLPVEFDASFRARKALLETGIVTEQEARGVSAVLTAAAATYLAAAVSAILQLLYWAMRAGLLGGRDD
ncbi:MAG: zinc metallopeptidase [Myxococcota bacterium]|nr:zinc metallopeptidase [Myxococcota bacterium]